MNHLNEDRLIQYAFGLLEQADKETAQQHLDDCSECREALDTLKTKFTALDTLAEEVPPSEELIAQTLNVNNKSKDIPLYRRAWVQWTAAAAAIAIVCTLMLQNPPETTIKEPAPKGSDPVAKLDTPQQKPAMPFPDDRMAALSSQDSPRTKALPLPRASTAQRGGGYSDNQEDIRIVSVAEIPDEPPFAPASAIELVVLPKPDTTQVTIYNSKDLTLVRD
ncbi:MAG: hypothetical protein ACYSSM_07590, partial [Planctomycetota bacterium]